MSEKAAGEEEDVFVVFVKFVFPWQTYLARLEVTLTDSMGLEAYLRLRWHRNATSTLIEYRFNDLPLDTRVAVLRHTHFFDLFFAASMHGQTSSTCVVSMYQRRDSTRPRETHSFEV